MCCVIEANGNGSLMKWSSLWCMHIILVNPWSFLCHEIAFVQDEVGLIELYEHEVDSVKLLEGAIYPSRLEVSSQSTQMWRFHTRLSNDKDCAKW